MAREIFLFVLVLLTGKKLIVFSKCQMCDVDLAVTSLNYERCMIYNVRDCPWLCN